MMHHTHGESFNLNRLFKQFKCNLFKLNNLQCDMAFCQKHRKFAHSCIFLSATFFMVILAFALYAEHNFS